MDNDIQATLERLAAHPEDEQALDRLETLCVTRREFETLLRYYEDWTARLSPHASVDVWTDLAERLEEVCAEQDEPELRAELLYVTGEIWNHKVGRQDKAMVLFQQAFRTFIGLTRALDAAREIYHQQGNHRMVVRLFELQAQVTEDPGEAAELYFNAGQVLLDQVEDREAAADHFRKAAELAPEEVRYVEALSFLEAVEQNWERLVARFREEAEGATDPTLSASLFLRAAEILGEHDGETAELRQLAQQALQRDPTNERAAELLRRLAQPGSAPDATVEQPAPRTVSAFTPLPASIAALTEDSSPVAQTAAPGELGETMPALQTVPVAEVTPVAVVVPVAEAVPVAEVEAMPVAEATPAPPAEPEQPAQARVAAPPTGRVVTTSPAPGRSQSTPPVSSKSITTPPVSSKSVTTPPASRSTTTPPASRTATVPPVDPEVQARLAKARSREERVALLRQIAVEQAEAGDTDGAVARLDQALGELPGDPACVEELTRILCAADRLGQLGDLLEDALRKMKRGPAEDALVRQVARVHWKVRGDLDGAEKLWRRVKLAAPRDEEMLEFYAELYEQQEDYKRLLSILASLQAVQESVESKVATGRRMALIAEEKLQNHEKAIDVWKGVARISPALAEVRDALKRLFRATEKWNALLEYYKEEIGALPASAVEEKVKLHKEMLTIYQDHLHLDVMVINTYNAILQIDSANEEALDALAIRYEKAARWNDLIGVLKRQTEIDTDPEHLVELWRQIANLYLERFSNQAQAVKPLEQILEVRPDDRETLSKLKEIYRQRRSWKQLLSVLSREAETVEGAERAALLEEAAQLAQERLNLPEEAVGLWRARLALAEGELPAQAVAALDGLYTKGKLHEELAGLLELQLERMGGERAVRYPILCRLGRLLVTPLARPSAAIGVWREALSLAPKGDAEPRQALEGLYRQGEAWDELEELLATPADQPRLADLLEQVARTHTLPEVRAGLWRRVIRIAEGQLADDNRVLRAREALLELEPENLEVVRELAPVYRQRAAWARLSTMLEIQLAHEREPGSPARRTLFEQLWTLHEAQIGDAAAAFRWCGRAFGEFPTPAVEQQLVRLAEKTDAWESLVLITREVAAQLDDAGYQLTLHLLLGEVCMTRLGWVDEAIDYFSKALLEDPESRPALDALEKLYARTKRWTDLLGVLQRRVPLAADDAERIAIHFRVAQIEDEFLGRPTEAVAALTAVLDIDPAEPEALRGLERLYSGLEQWARLSEIVARQVELAAGPAERADRIFLLARLHEEHLAELSRAVDLHAELLALQPEHAGAVERLESLLAREVEPQRVAALLEPAYRSRGDWRRLAGVLDVLRLGAADPLAKVALLKEVAALAEDRLAEPARAMTRLLDAFRLTPEDRPLWDELDRLAAGLDRWSELADTFAELVEQPGEALTPTDRLELALRVGEIKEKQGARPAAALAYRRALALDEAAPAAISALERLHQQLEQWPELVEILELEVVLADSDEARCGLLFRICSLQEEALSDPAAAIGTYLRVLELDDRRLDAWLALERLYGEGRRHAELADLLTRLIGVQGDSAEGIAARHRLGQVQQLHLADPLAAVESYRQVLLRTPHEPTIAALQQLLSSPPEGLVAPEEFVRTVTEILEQVYLVPGGEHELIKVLDRRLGVAHDPDEQVELLVRIASLHEQTTAVLPGFAALARALAVCPYRQDVAAELHRLARAHGLWEELVSALQLALTTAPDADVQIRLLRTAANVAIEQLRRSEQAEGFLRRILALDPTDAAALDELERTLRQRGDHEGVVAVLRQKVELAERPARRIELLHQVGEVLDLSLDLPDQAIDAYRAVLAIDDREARALDALERILESNERWAELVALLQHRVECVDTVEQRKRLHARIATIFDVRLRQADEAIGAWRAILDLDADDRQALAELDRLHEREQQWVDLLDILVRRIELAADPQERGRLQLRCGHLLADRLDDAARAIEAFREVLLGAPSDAGARAALEALLQEPAHRGRAAETLEPFYVTLEAWQPLRDSLEIRLLDCADPDTRLDLLLRIAELAEQSLGDRNGAFDALARAFTERRADLRPVEGMHRLAGLLGRWDDLVAILQAGAEEEADGTVVKDLRLRVARILHHQVEDMQAAQRAYRQVLEVDGEEHEALDSLEAIYAALGAHEELLEIYRTKVAISPDDAERILLLLQVTRVHRDILERPQGAIDALRQILSLREDHPEANQALTALLTFEARWPELADHLLHRLGLAQDTAERVRLQHELGRIYMDRLDNAGGAIACFAEVLDQQPGHAGSVTALEDYLTRRVEVEAVADLLEPLYRQQQAWPKVVEVAAARRGATEDPQRRAELALQIAHLQEERLRDPDAAFTILAGALTENPEQMPVRVELERLADEVGGWFEVTELFARLVGGITDPEAALAMRRSLARACDERLNDYDRAQAQWELVFDLDENDVEAVEALERIFTRTEKWAALVDLYRKRADRTLEPKEKIAILGKVCNLYEEVLDDPVQAIDVYRQIIDVDPEHVVAVRGLDRLLNLLERWDELAELLMQQAELSQGEEQLQLRQRLAVLLHEHLERNGDAIDTFRTILVDAPGHPAAIRALEGILGSLVGKPDEALNHRQQIIDLLEPHYVEREDWPHLIGLHEIRFADAEDAQQRVALLRQIAEVQERRMREPNRAFGTLCQAMTLDFGSREVAEELNRLAEELNAWDRLINVYIDGLEGVEEHEVAVAMLLELASIFDTRLHHVPNAVECYRRLLTLEEGHPEALDALERLYLQAGAHERLVEVLTDKASRTHDPLEKKDLYYRICEIWDEILNNREEAIRAYRTLLELDSEDLTAIDALQRLYRATSDWPNLVEIYQQKVTLAQDAEEQVACLFEIATLQDEALHDADAAVQACRQVHDLDPVNPRAFGMLQLLFKREKRFNDLLSLLEQALGIASSPAAMDAIQMQIAELQAGELQAVEDAIETWRTILDRSPRHEGAIGALERQLAVPAYRDRAARVLEPQYETAGNHAALVRVLDVQRQECPDSVGRVELYKRMALLHELELGDARAAFDNLGAAFREDPLDGELLTELERLTRELDDLRSFAALLTEVLEKTDDSQVQRDLSRRLARLHDLELGDGAEAIPHYRRLLEFDEIDAEALEALDRIHAARNEHTELLAVLQRRVGIAQGEEAIGLRFRLGQLQEEQFGELTAAVEQYRQILWEEPGHTDARAAMELLSISRLELRVMIQEVLEPIYWSEEAWVPLVGLFGRRLELAETAAERAALHLQIGDLLESKQSDDRSAFTHYRDALAEEYGDGLALENMRRLVEGLGAWRELAESLVALLGQLDDPEAKRELTLELAGIERTRLSDDQAAEGHYLTVLADEPENSTVLEALEAIYRQSAEVNKLVGILHRRVAVELDPTAKIELLREAASLSAEMLDDPQGAEQDYRQILELDESDEPTLQALERLVDERGDKEELVQVLQRRVQHCMDSAELMSLNRRMGRLALELGRRDEAIDRFRSCLDMDPTSEELLATLQTLQAEAEQWDEVKSLLVQRLGNTDDPTRRVEHLLALATLAEERFHDAEEAEGYVRQVLELEPGDGEAQARLERLLQTLERWWDLVELYRDRAREAKDPALALELLLKVSRLAREKLSDLGLAKETLQEVLAQAPEHPEALDGLVELYEADGDWEKCLEVLDVQLTRSSEPARLADLLFKKGSLLAEKLDRVAEAISVLPGALEQQPNHGPTLALLKELYRRLEDWESYVGMVSFQEKVSTDPAERFALLKEQAELYRDRLNDPDSAVLALELANELSPGDAEIVRPLVDAYLAASQWDKARPLLETLVAQLREGRKFRELPRLLHRLGLVTGQLGLQDEALEHFKAAHDLDATYLPNLIDLGKAYYTRSDWNSALKVFQTMLLHQSELKNAGERVDVFFHLGMVRRALGDDRRAKDMFLRALAIDPKHPGSQTAMSEMN